MPHWVYEISPLKLALIMSVMIEVVSLIGLTLARRFVLPHLRFHDGVNDAISGTVQAIGVFYGITVTQVPTIWFPEKPQPSVACIATSVVIPNHCVRTCRLRYASTLTLSSSRCGLSKEKAVAWMLELDS